MPLPKFSNTKTAIVLSEPVYLNHYEINIHNEKELLSDFSKETFKFEIDEDKLTLHVNIDTDSITNFFTLAETVKYININIHNKLGLIIKRFEFVAEYKGFKMELNFGFQDQIVEGVFKYIIKKAEPKTEEDSLIKS